MKNYALFAGYNYYPGGGFEDLQGFFDTTGEAVTVANGTSKFEWYHIVDTKTFTVVITG